MAKVLFPLASYSHCSRCGGSLAGKAYWLVVDGWSGNTQQALCARCKTIHFDESGKRVRTWMYLHREEMGMQDIPFDVVKYCSQSFHNINANTIGYDVPWNKVETQRIKIPSLSFYGTTCGANDNRFNGLTLRYLEAHSREDFIVAEVVYEAENPYLASKDIEELGRRRNVSLSVQELEAPMTLQNMAIRWKETDPITRESLSDRFRDLVYGFGGSIRPDYMDYDGWDTFESE